MNTKPKNNKLRVKKNKTPGITKVKAPITTTLTIVNTPPKITPKKNGVSNIKHSEYIQDITSPSSVFNLQKFSINAGIAGTFPWLSRIAGQYEYYHFRSLRFEYRPTCPTTQAGAIYMAIDYDAADPSPTNKQSMMAYDSSCRTSVWTTLSVNSKNSSANAFSKEHFTRVAGVTGDIKTYDVGNLFVATSNTTGSDVLCGELYVHYDVDLRSPQIGLSNPSATPYQVGTITVDNNNNCIVKADTFNTTGRALWWVDNVVKNLNTTTVNLLIDSTIGPSILRFATFTSRWAKIGSRWNSILSTAKNVYDFYRSTPADNVLLNTIAAAVGPTNYDNTDHVMSSAYIIGSQSAYQTNAQSRTYVPLSIEFSSSNGVEILNAINNGLPLSVSLMSVAQTIVDKYTEVVNDRVLSYNNIDWLWPTKTPPFLDNISPSLFSQQIEPLTL